MAIDLAVLSDAAGRRAHVRSAVLPTLDTRPFINGDFLDAVDDNVIQVTDPMTGEILAGVPEAGRQVVDAAVSAARKSFDSGVWRNMHPRARARYLFRLADLVEANLEELALLEATDAGKRLVGIRAWDIPNAAEVYRYYAGWADKIPGRVLPSPAGVDMFTRREPVGVSAAIMPWNFPFPCMAWKLGPALAAGCSVIIKSAERAPLSAQYLARLVRDADFPPGVVNIISGRGETTGRSLVSDERVDKISLTGDVETARDILVQSLGHLPRVTFELGDKLPNVILADADLAAATSAAAGAMFGVSGQNCCAGSRLLVEESVAEDVIQGVAALARNRRLGDPLDEATDQGPQIDARHIERIAGHVEDALAEGARCITGGSVAGDRGQFYEPTVLAQVTNQMKIARAEVFGPVGAVLTFRTLDEAIAIANDREYGLGAAIWTTNPKAADEFAREVRAGTCWINCYEYFDTVAPWGGRKRSGVGRELGAEGIDAYLETKTVVRAL